MLTQDFAPVQGEDGLHQATTFARALCGVAPDAPDPVLLVQTFPEGDAESEALPALLSGTIPALWDRIKDLEDHWHGAFIPVNRCDGRGRRAENVVGLQALVLDCDGNAALDPLKLALAPSALVLTGAADHWHAWYWLAPGEALADFTPAQLALAQLLGTDRAVADLARVMRIPGTHNSKNRARPLPAELVWCRETPRYTIREVLAAFGLTLEAARAAPAVTRRRRVEAPAPSKAKVLGSTSLLMWERYREKVFAVAGQSGNLATYRVACAAFEKGDLPEDVIWEGLKEWNRTNATPPWEEVELGRIFRNAKAYHQHDRPVSPVVADLCSGIGEGGEGVIPEDAATRPQLDPARWCVEAETNRWRYWDGQRWGNGIPERGLDRTLENEGGLGARKRDAWKRRVAVVEGAAPVFSSRERIAELDGRRLANLYRWPTLTPAPGDWDPIRRVLSNLVGGSAEHLEYLIAFLASTAQRAFAGVPTKKGVALDFFGPPGAGKGVLEVVISGLLGPHNVATIGQGDLATSHNAWMVGKLFVVADEVEIEDGRRSAQSAKLKKLITAPTLMVNPKGRDQIQIQCVEQYAFFANHSRVTEIERADRRHTVFKTGDRIPVELGALVADDARAGGPLIRAFLAALLKLPHPDRIAPDYVPLITQAKAEVARSSGTSATRFAAEVQARGFYSVTGAWAGDGVGRSLRDLYLAAHDGLRSVELAGRTWAPVISRRRLLEVYRAFASEIGAPALRESVLLGALRDVLPDVREAELLVDGRCEPVIVGLPGMLPALLTTTVAPAEPARSQQPQQRTLTL